MEKRQPSYTIGRNVIGTVTMENSMEFPLKAKNRAAIWSSNPTPEKTIHPEKTIIWKDTFESILMRWMKLEPIIQSEVSQKDKDHYNILTHIYGI